MEKRKPESSLRLMDPVQTVIAASWVAGSWGLRRASPTSYRPIPSYLPPHYKSLCSAWPPGSVLLLPETQIKPNQIPSPTNSASASHRPPRKVRRCKPCSHMHSTHLPLLFLPLFHTAPTGVRSNSWWVGSGSWAQRICGSLRPGRAVCGIPRRTVGISRPAFDSLGVLGFFFPGWNALPCLPRLARNRPRNAPSGASFASFFAGSTRCSVGSPGSFGRVLSDLGSRARLFCGSEEISWSVYNCLTI
jgi:hypothetical protein